MPTSSAMTVFPAIRLVGHELKLTYPPANIDKLEPLPDEAQTLFSGWCSTYERLARQRDKPRELLALGTRMLADLLPIHAFLNQLIEEDLLTPLIVEFGIAKTDDSPLANAFLDAPWELLADNGRHLALAESIRFCPIRRIGQAGTPEAPSKYRLNVVFMAAAPRRYDNLDFENEEVELLEATQTMEMDFACEESGTLDLLARRVAHEEPDVVHLTCHGVLKPKPILLLEDETGERKDIAPDALVHKLPQPLPRLLFSSACETAQADERLTSLTKHLIRAGAPAALGWAAPVLDNEATLFAAALYEKLAGGEELAMAMVGARYALQTSDKLRPKAGLPSASTDWHLARLTLGGKGGGKLATPQGHSRHQYQGIALRRFLDERKEVPIASEREFVGRRRYIQEILRAFRSSPPGHAGILLRGFGGQGKSSLAGRIAHRMEGTHRAIIVFGKANELNRYGAEAILGRFLDSYAGVKGIEAFEAMRTEVRNNPSRLEAALIRLLEDVCGQGGALPALLIIDDLEKILLEQPGSDHIVRADYRQTLRAVLRAFDTAVGNSRLLLTSRYLFTLPDEPRGNLVDRLLDLPLPPMQEREARKQFAAKLRATQQKPGTQAIAISPQQFKEILAVSEGVPRLQDILFRLALEDTTRCDACLMQMRAYRAEGTAPSEQALRTLFTDLTIDALLDLLNEAQRAVLRASTLFELPVPEPVMRRLAEEVLADSRGEEWSTVRHRLTALALWDTHEDLHDSKQPAYGLHPLVRPRVGMLTKEEAKPLATGLAPALLSAWGGGTGVRARLLDSEIARLALAAEQAPVLAVTAVGRLRYLEERFELRQAAKEAVETLRVLDAANVPPSLLLLRLAAERCHLVGGVEEAARFREQALRRVKEARETNEAVDEWDHATLLVTHARALSQQGLSEEAQQLLQEAVRTFEQLEDTRSRTIALGYIARILTDKGEVDDALKLHQERLKVYEQLGDTRGRAITLGNIARILKDKGEVDEALELHQEQIHLLEQLGDTRERAIALGDLARILRAKGEVDEALELHQEQIHLLEQLGDTRERAIALGDLARILRAKGEVDEALELHQEQIQVYEQLGDTRERAIALGDLARILRAKGEVDEALELHQEQIQVYEQLGDMDGTANALWSIAMIQLQQQQFQEAANNLQRSYAINMRLGRLDGICHVGISWGQILLMAGQRDEGMTVLTRSRDGFERLRQPGLAQQVQALIDQIG